MSPVEILDDEDGNVAGLKIERNTLDDAGNAVGTGETEVLPVQMVLRSVGYRGVALPGVPFDERRGRDSQRGGPGGGPHPASTPPAGSSAARAA